MTEPVTDTLAPPTPADMPQQVPVDPPADEAHEDSPEQQREHLRKMRLENKSLRAKLKEVEPLAKAAQDAAEAKKDGEQKAIERAEAAEAREKLANERAAQLDLAVMYKLDPDDIDLLGSGTREEMDVRAQRIAAKNAAASKASPPPSDRPVEGLRPGATPEPAKTPDDSYPSEWTPKYLRGEGETRSFSGQ